MEQKLMTSIILASLGVIVGAAIWWNGQRPRDPGDPSETGALTRSEQEWTCPSSYVLLDTPRGDPVCVHGMKAIPKP